MNNQTTTSSGLGWGVLLAVIISWTESHSILWALLHGVCSWLYVLYYVCTRQ